MKKPAFFATVVCLICCYGISADAQSVVQVWPSHFIGPSKATTDGNAGGVISMNQLCMNTPKFGSAAHICNVEEFYGTAGVTTKAGGITMWVRPAFGNCVFNTTIFPADTICLETGTLPADPKTLGATCNGFTSNALADLGTTVNTFTTGTSVGVTNVAETCSSSLPVACCSP
jgi:hypothetical protein